MVQAVRSPVSNGVEELPTVFVVTVAGHYCQKMTDVSVPLDLKSHLSDADGIVDHLPWMLGTKPAHQKLARGRASALAHHIAALLAGGWTLEEIQTAISTADVSRTPDAAAQERLWRKALKRAKNGRAQQ